ncbi:MAG: chemotaxis protein CheD [Gammaproteobacteria bacterium]
MDAAPQDCLEIFLNPGELFFGSDRTRIRTLLGSCVAVTVWHPRHRLGGMCHCVLPGRSRGGSGVADLRHVDDALDTLVLDLRSQRVPMHEVQCKLFGGGRMFSSLYEDGEAVGRRNVQSALDAIDRVGLRLSGWHTGGNGHRNVVLDLWSGAVWVRYGQGADGDEPVRIDPRGTAPAPAATARTERKAS